MSDVVLQERGESGLRLKLNRPQVHNALDSELMGRLQQLLQGCREDHSIRYLVFEGEGRSFCAGADLQWMKAAGSTTDAENREDAGRLWRLLETIVTYPKPVIAKVQGVALGGGVGLVAACDLVVAEQAARFGLSEVRLGLAPAMIMPFLLRKGRRHALLMAALTGERFTAEAAQAMGLVHEVSADPEQVVDQWASALCAGGPVALSSIKQLFSTLADGLSWEESRDHCVAAIAGLRASPEGQEGIKAFLERRKPQWASNDDQR